MRRHGTRACYVFGPEPGSDHTRGCRCEPCKAANRTYERDRDRARRRPDVKVEPAYIDAGEARAHLAWLRSQGVGLRTVSERAGIARSTLAAIATGRRTRCAPTTADRVLAVIRSAARGAALVDATDTWRRINDMLAHGWTRTAIADALGQTASRPALQLGRHRVTAANADAVRDLYEREMRPLIRERELAAQRRARYRAVEKAAA